MSYDILPLSQPHRQCVYDGCTNESEVDSSTCAIHGVAYIRIRRNDDSRKATKRKKVKAQVQAATRAAIASKYSGTND